MLIFTLILAKCHIILGQCRETSFPIVS
jgi:hypothetical protein